MARRPQTASAGDPRASDPALSPPTAAPALALAPMQDVTDLPLWRALHPRGDPDHYYTEYVRVHRDSRPQKERQVLRAVDGNPSGKPVAVQMIGRHLPALVRTADFLQRRGNVAAVDLNLGCPSPTVCSKEAGGGLLRHPDEIDSILAALRDTVTECQFSVKTRIGFDSPDEFDRLLEVFSRHQLDRLAVHGRTVREKYATAVHYDAIAHAVRALPYPVFANGNVVSVRTARQALRKSGAAGLMIGRGVLRNPFLFAQLHAAFAGVAPPQPSLRDIHSYLNHLWDELKLATPKEITALSRLKRHLNFVGQGLAGGQFLTEARHATAAPDLAAVLDRYLLDDSPFPDEPPPDSKVFAGLAGTPPGDPG